MTDICWKWRVHAPSKEFYAPSKQLWQSSTDSHSENRTINSEVSSVMFLYRAFQYFHRRNNRESHSEIFTHIWLLNYYYCIGSSSFLHGILSSDLCVTRHVLTFVWEKIEVMCIPFTIFYCLKENTIIQISVFFIFYGLGTNPIHTLCQFLFSTVLQTSKQLNQHSQSVFLTKPN